MFTKTNLYITIRTFKLIFQRKHRIVDTINKNAKTGFKTISILQEIQTIQILH